MDGKFTLGNLESRLYELGIRVTGHKKYYESFFFQSSLDLDNGCSVLDAGCGGGLLAMALLNEYNRRRGTDITVHAFDIAPSMLYLARGHATRMGFRDRLKLYEANGENLSDIKVFGDEGKIALEDESFDLVMSSGMLEYINNPKKAIEEMARVLRPGGQLIFSFVRNNLLGLGASRLWKFSILSDEWLRHEFYQQGIRDFKEFPVISKNYYMKALKSICIGRKS